jgi:hypothetical protein
MFWLAERMTIGYTHLMNTPDPLLHRNNDQGDRIDSEWRMIPAYQEAYNFRPKAPGEIPTRMMAHDWGTEENPGVTFWTLRGLINSAWRGQPCSMFF